MITSGQTQDRSESDVDSLCAHLAVAVKSLPLGLLFLDWNLRAWWFNDEAARVCAVWNHGERDGTAYNENRVFCVPPPLLNAAASLRARRHDGRAITTTVLADEPRGLHARIALHQSSSGVEGAFHIQLDYRRLRGDHGQPMSADALALFARLSAREREVALRIREGLTTAEIATALHRSPLTVKSQLSAVFAKLGVRTRTRVATLLNR